MADKELELALQHGLTEEEFGKIVEILDRRPNLVEIGMYSVMWSEHCSYKNSIAELKKLPRSGKRLLVSAGEENAGLVDIGDGLAVAFKIESHNHPSAVEPYQGAATGVGGILRDIFTMGARPIAALDSLRFGSPDHPKTAFLVKGVVKGIGDYGNSFGVPTVAGDVYFNACYNENPLVNAMAVGIVKHERVARASAHGPGNLVLLVGSSTGRDGIHGASFASENISDESESKRPSVQVGDPFTEKLLLEATLEVIGRNLVVGIQDMGAAGITCSTTEMSARGGCGMDIDLDRVPVRESGMTAYEIMLSESQERMLVVARPENESALMEVYRKWDLHCCTIGTVTADGRIRVRKGGEVVADVPADSMVLGGGAPVYIRKQEQPSYLDQVHHLDEARLPVPVDLNLVLLQLLKSPNICSRKWVFRQYDSMVRTNTVLQADGDAAVIRIKGTDRGIALKTDCNPRYVFLNPFKGAQIAVAESARNVASVGGTPVGITNCLNFGNPYDPGVYWQFAESIRGISAACNALETPVTGGNVSFYNQGISSAIYPTPVIGMLGIVNDITHVVSAAFQNVGDQIILLGITRGHIGGTEYLEQEHGMVAGDAPDIDLAGERRAIALVLHLIHEGLIQSCHDLSDGGLAVALAEACILTRDKALGAKVAVQTTIRPDFFLFGEDQGRYVISCHPSAVSGILEEASQQNVPAMQIGVVAEGRLEINGWVDVAVRDIGKAYEESFPI